MKKRLVLAAFVLCIPALWAADGVIEINQADVEANGGFPYVISEPGSYMLTGNLSVPDENTSAIEVQAVFELRYELHRQHGSAGILWLAAGNMRSGDVRASPGL